MKSFRERNPIIIGTISLAALALVTAGLLSYNTLPFTSPGTTYRAYFEELGGLATGAPVEVSGLESGKVKDITLDPQGVLVEFTVADNIRLGESTEVAIKTKTLLGAKFLQGWDW